MRVRSFQESLKKYDKSRNRGGWSIEGGRGGWGGGGPSGGGTSWPWAATGGDVTSASCEEDRPCRRCVCSESTTGGHQLVACPLAKGTLATYSLDSIFGDFHFFSICSDLFGRLQPLITTPENPQVKVILCQHGARGGVYVLT